MDIKHSINSPYFLSREFCPACSSSNLKVKYISPFCDEPINKYLLDFYGNQGFIEMEYLENENYELIQCASCSLVFQKNIPGELVTNKLYNEWIDPEFIQSNYEKNLGLDYYKSLAKSIFKIITVLNKNPKEMTFLDFGMGWGNWCRMASSFGVETYGIEISEDRINHAQKYGIMNLDIHSLKDNTYDFINTDQVFEHIPNPLEILKILSKSLKVGGIVRICVPDGNKVNDVLASMNWELNKIEKNSVNIISPLEHINCFTTQSIVTMANKAGLDWYFVPKYPLFDKISSLPSLNEKIKISLSIPIHILQPLWLKLRGIFGKNYIEKPKGTNLFFIKK